MKEQKKIIIQQTKTNETIQTEIPAEIFFQNLSFKFLKLTVVRHLASLRPQDQYKSMTVLFVFIRQPLM